MSKLDLFLRILEDFCLKAPFYNHWGLTFAPFAQESNPKKNMKTVEQINRTEQDAHISCERQKR
jgi:hypothetical protein